MRKNIKKQASFLPFYEGFKPGQDKYQLFLKIKQPTQDYKLSYPNLEIINDQNMLVNASNEKKLSKKEQKEKVFTFNTIFHQRITNEEFYKQAFQGLVQKFLSGISQTILVIGPKLSGKTQTTIGSVRDPGILLFFLQDLFNYIEDNFFEDHITVKLSVFEHHPTRGFRDLLVDSSYEFQPYQQPNGENQLLGIPEIIVDNFLLAMKIIRYVNLFYPRISLANLQQLEQHVDGETYLSKVRETSLIFEVKAEIAPSDDVREQVIVSKTKFIKILNEFQQEGQKQEDGSFTTDLTTIMRLMSEASQQKNKKLTNISFRNSVLLDYLRVSLTSASQVTLLCCINTDYHETLRIANHASQILSGKQISQFSIYYWNLQLKDFVENQKEALSLFYKEFFHPEQKKIKRGQTIFQIISDLQTQLNNFTDILEGQREITYTLNCLYSQVLSNHCSKYSTIITTEDVKEFYLAKIEIYAIEQIKNYQEQIGGYVKSNLSQLYNKHIEMRQCKMGLSKFINNINSTTYPDMTNFDIQKMTNMTKLSLKLVNLFSQTAAQNIFNHKESRDTLVYLFKEINQVAMKYLDTTDEVNDQPKQEYQQSNLDILSGNSIKEYSIISDLIIQLPETAHQQKPHNRKMKTTLYDDDDNDLISRLFKNKNTRNYNHIDMFQTQPIIRSLNSPTLIQKLKVQISPSTKYNFFQELNKKQKQSGDIKVNPNQIRQMVREWQDKNIVRRFRSTGISFMKQSYATFQDGQRQIDELIIDQPKTESILPMMIHKTEEQEQFRAVQKTIEKRRI